MSELQACVEHHDRSMDIIEEALGDDRHQHEGVWLAPSIAMDIQALRAERNRLLAAIQQALNEIEAEEDRCMTSLPGSRTLRTALNQGKTEEITL